MRFTLFILLILFVSCTGSTHSGSQSECTGAYVEAMYDIKSTLKDPSSYDENAVKYFKSSYDGQSVCAVEIDFTATNGFGGPGRKVIRYIYDMNDKLIVKAEK